MPKRHTFAQLLETRVESLDDCYLSSNIRKRCMLEVIQLCIYPVLIQNLSKRKEK